MSPIPQLVEQSEDDIARRFRQRDAIMLDLYLPMPEAARAGVPHFVAFPHRLEMPSMLRLLETEEGRTMFACLPRVRFQYLSRHLRDHHEMEVARIYVIGVDLSSVHLRFVLDGSVEVRYDANSEVVESSADGLRVFESRFLERCGHHRE